MDRKRRRIATRGGDLPGYGAGRRLGGERDRNGRKDETTGSTTALLRTALVRRRKGRMFEVTE